MAKFVENKLMLMIYVEMMMITKKAGITRSSSIKAKVLRHVGIHSRVVDMASEVLSLQESFDALLNYGRLGSEPATKLPHDL